MFISIIYFLFSHEFKDFIGTLMAQRFEHTRLKPLVTNTFLIACLAFRILITAYTTLTMLK